MNFLYVFLAILAVVVVVAIRWDNQPFRIVAVLALLLAHQGMRQSTDEYVRTLLHKRHTQGVLTNEYREGALAVMEYSRAARKYEYVIGGMILTVCWRGFKSRDRRKVLPRPE